MKHYVTMCEKDNTDNNEIDDVDDIDRDKQHEKAIPRWIDDEDNDYIKYDYEYVHDSGSDDDNSDDE
jgi:hypothetical protein